MIPTLYRLAFSRGESLGTQHHLVSTLAIPALLWCSEIWWTGPHHTADNLNSTYNKLARLISNLPLCTRTDLLLCSASLPPLELLLNHTSRKYSTRILQGPNNHPNKPLLMEALKRPLDKGTGLRRIAYLLLAIVPNTHRHQHRPP